MCVWRDTVSEHLLFGYLRWMGRRRQIYGPCETIKQAMETFQKSTNIWAVISINPFRSVLVLSKKSQQDKTILYRKGAQNMLQINVTLCYIFTETWLDFALIWKKCEGVILTFWNVYLINHLTLCLLQQALLNTLEAFEPNPPEVWDNFEHKLFDFRALKSNFVEKSRKCRENATKQINKFNKQI